MKRCCQQGISLIEVMISLGLGVFLLLGIIGLVAEVSGTRGRLSEASNQIENSRFALQVLSEELPLAGFYGHYHPGVEQAAAGINIVDYTWPDPCEDGSSLDDLGFLHASPLNMPIPVAGYPAGSALPACLAEHGVITNSEVLAIHRVGTTPVDVDSISAGNTIPFLQINNCSEVSTDFAFDSNPGSLTLENSDCDDTAAAWPYQVSTFFIASCENCSSGGDGRSTLKVLEYVNGSLTATPLVSGVEDIHYSYGLDLDKDGAPDCYVDDPRVNTPPTGCPSANWSTTDIENWEDVTTLRVSILVRGETPILKEVSKNTYDMGRTNRAGPFNDLFKRHVISTVITLPNIAGPRG